MKILDGLDKQKFYIFYFCGNFEFFRMNEEKPTANMMALQGAIFNLEFQMAYKLQNIKYVVHNGIMKDLSVLQESPFTDRGSVVEIFTDISFG